MADKILSIGLGANTTGLKKDMDNAAAIVKSAGQQMGDAVSQSADKMSSSSKKAGENLQQAYKAAARDARQAALQFGETSDRFRIAAQTAGELKDRLELTNQTIKAFSSDAPVLSATVGVMHSMAGAFSAAQGAAALFGTEGKALQETMLKVQAAMALTQGLQALTEAGDAFRAMKTVIVTTVIPAIASIGLETAIATGGLTILVGLVALFVKEQMDTKAATEAASEAQKKQNENLETYSRVLKGLTTTVKDHNKELRLQVAAKEAGVSVDAMKAMNLEKSIADREKKLAELTALREKQRVELQNSAGTANVGKLVYSKDLEVLQRQITALKELQKELKISANLQSELNQKTNLGKSKNNAMPELEYNGLPQPIELQGRGLKVPTLAQGIANMNKLIASVPKEPIVVSFKLEGLDNVQLMGQRLAILKNSLIDLGNILKGHLTPALQTFGNMIGKSLGGEKIDGGQALKAMLADVSNSMAMTMYAMAAGFAAIGDYGHAAAATAAGIGLNIVAGILSAQASSSSAGVSSSGGSVANAGTFGNGGNSNYGVITIGGQVRGNNLLLAINRSGYQTNRVK